MSLKAHAICPVPTETIRVARAVYLNGNLYMQMRDVLGTIYTDEDFADLFPKEGQPAEAPWRLALITVMQFLENLSDRQAADSVRGRIDWKYLLGLELTDAGFDASVLSEFRARLVEHHGEQLLLETMLTLFQQKGWLKARGRQRTDSTHVLAKIRALNRVLCVWETMRAVLNGLAVVAPEWLRAHSHPDWVDRYGPRSEDSRSPLGEEARIAFAEEIGEHGRELLTALFDPLAPSGSAMFQSSTLYGRCGCKTISALMTQFGGGPLRVFLHPLAPSALRDARRGSFQQEKEHAPSVGYKVHLTESYEAHLPLIITHVETTSAPVSDDAMTAIIHASLIASTFCPLNISWILAMWMQSFLWRAHVTTKLT